MKRIARNLVVLAVFAMALIGLAQAQQFHYRVTANIPVDFYIGDQHYSAGNYLFLVNYGDHAVTVRNQASGQSAVVLASPVVSASPGYDNRDKGTVVELNSVGGKYVLSYIATRENGVSIAERNSYSTLARNEKTLTIVATLR